MLVFSKIDAESSEVQDNSNWVVLHLNPTSDTYPTGVANKIHIPATNPTFLVKSFTEFAYFEPETNDPTIHYTTDTGQTWNSRHMFDSNSAYSQYVINSYKFDIESGKFFAVVRYTEDEGDGYLRDHIALVFSYDFFETFSMFSLDDLAGHYFDLTLPEHVKAEIVGLSPNGQIYIVENHANRLGCFHVRTPTPSLAYQVQFSYADNPVEYDALKNATAGNKEAITILFAPKAETHNIFENIILFKKYYTNGDTYTAGQLAVYKERIYPNVNNEFMVTQAAIFVKYVDFVPSDFDDKWSTFLFRDERPTMTQIGTQRKMLFVVERGPGNYPQGSYYPDGSFNYYLKYFELSFDDSFNHTLTVRSTNTSVLRYTGEIFDDWGSDIYGDDWEDVAQIDFKSGDLIGYTLTNGTRWSHSRNTISLLDGAAQDSSLFSYLNKTDNETIVLEQDSSSYRAFYHPSLWRVLPTPSSPTVGDATDPAVIAATISSPEKFAEARVFVGGAVFAKFSQAVDPRTTPIRTAGGLPLPVGSLLRSPKKDTYTADDVAVFIKTSEGDDSYAVIKALPPSPDVSEVYKVLWQMVLNL